MVILIINIIILTNIIKKIFLACEPAGPGFDHRSPSPDHRPAAQNVQCIHTSSDKGTRHTASCHQNWKMGNCGLSQIGASAPPLGSHGLCPYFYNAAFKYDFYASEKPTECRTRHMANSWPNGFKMGYMENRTRFKISNIILKKIKNFIIVLILALLSENYFHQQHHVFHGHHLI